MTKIDIFNVNISHPNRTWSNTKSFITKEVDCVKENDFRIDREVI